MSGTPETFARTTLGREGDRARTWLAELPALVEDLLARWACVPDGEALHGGVGLVVPVRRRTGDPAVLKVSFPHPGNVHEPDALAAWRGYGAVVLYERDDDHFAMLLERARSTTLAQVDDGDEVAAVAGGLNRRLAVPAPPGLPRLRERAAAWESRLRADARESAHTLAPHVVAAALATARELGFDQPELMVHGDLHAGNVLRAEREPWLAVDPKGLVGDPAYDAGTFLKSRVPTFRDVGDLSRAAHRALDIFVEAAGLDRERARQWAQLRAVQAAFSGRRHGFRRARTGPELTRLTALIDHLAEVLTRRS
ncbi:aminoglycoside phosphotransferase family protein [Streptomyces sp. SID3343]|uniref:aminoglycoside phosphotransferase family protein n=1 Tax=Streptomyces sp. SID3343 TaxID=2690260 RepID=UPI00136AB64F|nr:phosphotransferase [Streptomyces sp. SID3343]